MPVRWDDPCPVNILEALASGTPVIGSPRGSLPELISPDTGGLGTTLEELVALRGRLPDWDPHACRARAERHFSHRVMAQEYVRMYRALPETGGLAGGRAMPHLAPARSPPAVPPHGGATCAPASLAPAP